MDENPNQAVDEAVRKKSKQPVCESHAGFVLNVYKCPTCGGAARYDAATGALGCMWCGGTYSASQLEPKQVSSELQGYLCPECGAQLMTDDYIAADTCPYCGNNEVAPHRFDGDFKPDYIIPFSVTKQLAIELYENHVASKEFLPDGYANESRIVSMQGAYIPFWLKDGVIDFDCTYKSLDKTTSKSALQPKYFHRVGTYQYSRIPADGSKRMPDDLMDSIEPYDFSELAPFSAEYLPGFVAERFTISSEEVEERVGRRMGVAAILAAQETVPPLKEGPYIEEPRCSTYYRNEREEQVLLPVWLIVIAYGDAKYLAGVNGQTGNVAINLPIDENKRKDAVLKSTLKAELPWILGLLAIALACTIPMFVGRTPGIEDFAATAIIVVCFAGIGAQLIRKRLVKENTKVQFNMQNVREAKLTGTYDLNCMTLTLSEKGMGPLSPFATSDQ